VALAGVSAARRRVRPGTERAATAQGGSLSPHHLDVGARYERVWLSASILRLAATIPLFGVAWLLDDLLYGRRLREVAVTAPLIEISAGRSGSTQLARYLEEDPRLVAPAMLQCFFPYLWAWRLAQRTLGRLVTPEQVRERVLGSMPAPMRERHEADPFRTDTFELALLGRHLNHLSLRLGPQTMADDFSFGRLAPHNRALWESDFVRFFDGIAATSCAPPTSSRAAIPTPPS
jgi:hypothetical protein